MHTPRVRMIHSQDTPNEQTAAIYKEGTRLMLRLPKVARKFSGEDLEQVSG
jgi:hypothetical protein